MNTKKKNSVIKAKTIFEHLNAITHEKIPWSEYSDLDKKSFDYHQKSDEQYINYLTMVNTPFLIDKLEWGTSIRGA